MFLYYVPARGEAFTRAELSLSPFASLFWDLLKTDILFQTRLVQLSVRNNGPDGSSGLLLIPTPPEGLPDSFRIGYFAAEQTWIQAKDFWIGHKSGELPLPSQLQREYLVAGEEHVLGDGQVWVCPIIRRRGEIDLPSHWGVDPMTGQFQAKILEEYRLAWDVAQTCWDVVGGRRSLRLSEALSLCVDALSVNYRIGPVEATLLRLFDQTNYEAVMGAAIDQAFLREFMENEAQKKT